MDVVGVDLTEQMLRQGRRRVASQHAEQQIRLVAGRAPNSLPFPDESFDALTFTYLLRYVTDPAATLRELARVVRPGGSDREPRIRRAGAPGLAYRVAGELHPRGCSRPPGYLSGGREWARVGRFLGPSISETLPASPGRRDGRALA